MGHILLTGASGFVGGALLKDLVRRHSVVCIGRRKPELDAPFVKGLFNSPDDLKRLDAYEIDAVVHLAAVTGGCGEREAMLVNVEGTRCLMRYLIDRGVEKFVTASSIAAVGMQSPRFRPLSIPIPDEHPCLDRHAYGFSKYMMEEVTRYLARQNEQIDVINLRLASIRPDDAPRRPYVTGPPPEWTFGHIAVMYLSDCVRALQLAVESRHKPGVRIMNAVGPKACVAASVPDVIRTWYPDWLIDLSHYERPGHERDPVFTIRRIEQEIGFVPRISPLDGAA